MVLLRYPSTFSDSLEAAFVVSRQSFHILYNEIVAKCPFFDKNNSINILNFNQFDLQTILLFLLSINLSYNRLKILYIIVDKTLHFTTVFVTFSMTLSMFIYT